MKLAAEDSPQIDFSLLALIGYMEFALKSIKTGSSYTDKPLKEIKLMRDAAYGFLLDFNSSNNGAPSIDTLNSEQVQQRIFLSEAAERREGAKESLLSPSARGFMADMANPFLQFTLGKKLEFSEEMSESAYAQSTENIREQLKHLGENQIFLEAMAAARLVLINGMINKAAWLLAGCEPLPNPNWLEGTTTYKIASGAYDFIAEHTPESLKRFKSEVIDNATKILNKHGKSIASLGLSMLSEKSTYIDIATDAATLVGAAYGKYNIQAQNTAINEELSYLREYIESQNLIQDTVKERHELRECIDIKSPPMSVRLNDADKELKKLLAEYPVIGKIFDLDQKKFKSLKEKILFIEVAKDLIKKNNEATNPKDKIWDDPNAEISKGKKVSAHHYFKKLYLSKLKQFKDQGVDLFTNNTSESNYLVSIVTYPKFFKAANKFKQALSTGNPSAVNDSLNVLYYAFCKYYKDRQLADLNNQTLTQIQAHRMYVPSYDVSYDAKGREILGRKKIELAKMALEKKAQAMALDIMSKEGELPQNQKELKALYNIRYDEARRSLIQQDPLYSQEMRSPISWSNWVYSTSTGILSATNPWAREAKIRKKEKIKSKAVQLEVGVESVSLQAKSSQVPLEVSVESVSLQAKSSQVPLEVSDASIPQQVMLSSNLRAEDPTPLLQPISSAPLRRSVPTDKVPLKVKASILQQVMPSSNLRVEAPTPLLKPIPSQELRVKALAPLHMPYAASGAEITSEKSKYSSSLSSAVERLSKMSPEEREKEVETSSRNIRTLKHRLNKPALRVTGSGHGNGSRSV